MRTRFARLAMIPMLALALLGGSVVHASAATLYTSITTVAPNGDRTTTFIYTDGTVIHVTIKARAVNYV